MFDSSRLVELTALIAYLAVLLWIGVGSARRIRTSTDYTLAGRNVPWVVLLATTAATLIGGGASVGSVSRIYEIGVAAALVTCAWHLQLIFTGLWAAPRLRALNLVTVADFFELKFGRVARAMATAHCLLFLVGALVAQMAAMATITASIAGIPYGAALLIGAAVTIFYSTVGGMRAVVATDVLQFVVLVGGIAAASGMLIFQQGGFLPLAEQLGQAHFQITGHWSVTGAVSLFVAFLLGEMFIPTYTVRCFIARDARQARLGVAGSGLFLLLFLPIATCVLGLSAAAHPEVQQAAAGGVQQVFPALVRTTFHPAFAGVMIAAMAAAAMSSADSVLSCNATVVMQDIYRRTINPRAAGPDSAAGGRVDHPGHRSCGRPAGLSLPGHHLGAGVRLRLLGPGHGAALPGGPVLVPRRTRPRSGGFHGGRNGSHHPLVVAGLTRRPGRRPLRLRRGRGGLPGGPPLHPSPPGWLRRMDGAAQGKKSYPAAELSVRRELRSCG